MYTSMVLSYEHPLPLSTAMIGFLISASRVRVAQQCIGGRGELRDGMSTEERQKVEVRQHPWSREAVLPT